MEYIFSFDDIDDDKLHYAGGKGASLVKLKKHGLHVPNGYILLATAFEKNELCSKAKQELKELVKQLDGKCTYAVRSSALNEDGESASFAGAYETITDVPKEEIESAVIKVAKSADSVRVKKYAHCMSKEESGISVVIQRFVKPQFAGVLFTSDIISGSSAKMLGNYVCGEGEQLVSGNVNAENFSFDAMKYSYSGNKELKKYAKRLFLSAVKIRKLYDCPMDIEWAISNRKLYILQARPITTLIGKVSKSYQMNGSLSGEYLFSKTNVGEIFMSTVSPVTHSMMETIYEMMGVPCFVDNICGQAYCNLSVVCSLLVAMGLPKKKAFSIIGDLAGKIPDGVEVPIFPFDKGNFVKKMAKFAFGTKKKFSNNKEKEEFIETIPKQANDIIMQIRNCRDNTALLECYDTTCVEFISKAINVLTTFFVYMKPFLDTNKKLTRVAGEELAARLCAGSMGILESMKPMLMLEDVIAGNVSKEEYIRQCGHRSVNEMELAEPYPYENPDFPNNVIMEHIKTGIDVHKMQRENEEHFREAVEEFKSLYPKKAAWFDKTIAKFIKANQMRENVRSKDIWIFCILREFLLKAALLNGIDDDIFMLYFPEVFQLLKGDNSVLLNIPKRRENYEKYRTYPAFPNVIYGRFEPENWMKNGERRCDFFSAYGEVCTGADIKGFAGAAGIVTGKVRVIKELEDAWKLEKGEILITTATNIGWTVIFPKAAAIVTDIGAPLSHAAIVAREFGIPAVVGCGNATTLLKTGDIVKVNGSAGTVERIEEMFS